MPTVTVLVSGPTSEEISPNVYQVSSVLGVLELY